MTTVKGEVMCEATRRGVSWCLALFALAMGAAVLADGGATVEFDRAVNHFNHVLGTRTFGPAYQFTDEPAQIETLADLAREEPVALESFADTPTSLPPDAPRR